MLINPQINGQLQLYFIAHQQYGRADSQGEATAIPKKKKIQKYLNDDYSGDGTGRDKECEIILLPFTSGCFVWMSFLVRQSCETVILRRLL